MVNAGMLEGREVTWFPSYGAEIRGGTANCTVILSDAFIGSPVAAHPDILIVMNDESLNRFLPQLRRDGILFFDSSLIRKPVPRTDIETAAVPATDISGRLGDTKSANMVMFGGWIAKTGLVQKESAFQALESLMAGGKKHLIENNKKAISEGINYVEHTKS
jgi:2-oxoglutarate ferredoxin oxidoreductase subunit gamma